eukprot:7375799-Prymnesium_polylepis.1
MVRGEELFLEIFARNLKALVIEKLIDTSRKSASTYTRAPPMAPAALAHLVASKRFTSKHVDLPMVNRAQQHTHHHLALSQCERAELHTAGVGRRGGGAAMQGASFLPFVDRAASLSEGP